MDFLIIVVIFAVGGILLYICITPLQKSQMIRDREKAQAEAWAKARLKGPPQNAPTFCGDGQKQLDELHIALIGDVEED